MQHCGTDNVFRFNYDLFDSYTLIITKDGYEITDPIGRTINSKLVTSVYWRKPYPVAISASPNTEQFFEEQQRRCLVKELSSIAHTSDIWHLVCDPETRRIGKATQMFVAQRFFRVPEWAIVGPGSAPPDLSNPVAKALVQVPLDGTNFFVTQRVEKTNQLSLEYCWFLQNEVVATSDVTIVFACGRSFAWQLQRDPNEPIDWRIGQNGRNPNNWVTYKLSDEICTSLERLMNTLGLYFGRLDFLLDDRGILHFLEVNPNGQFAWLDSKNEVGMLDYVFSCAARPPANIQNRATSNLNVRSSSLNNSR